jgi:hypothetical protein
MIGVHNARRSTMNREQAIAEAARRNRELAERGETDARYVEVERGTGTWGVERRGKRGRWFGELLRRLMDAFPR